MSTPDKCPHCEAEGYKDSSPRMSRRSAGSLPWSCGTLRDTIKPIRSPVCFERELAETRKKLEQAKQSADMWHSRYEVQKQAQEFSELGAKKAEARVRELESDLASTKSELECEQFAGRQWNAQSLELSGKLTKAMERVRELEGLVVYDVRIFSDFVSASVTLPNNLRPAPGKTLGEVMPRKEIP